MSLEVKLFPYGPMEENTYLVTENASGYSAVVDPGYLIPYEEMGLRDKSDLKYILLTHGHYDHFAAAEGYITEYPEALFIAPAGEEYLLSGKNTENKWMAMQNGGSSACPPAGRLVSEGDTIILGDERISVIETPGHTEGGVCYFAGNLIFSGDTLFRLSVGNTSFETGDWDTMLNSIRTKLYTLDDDVVVYPGHGAATTIGYEKRANPFV